MTFEPVRLGIIGLGRGFMLTLPGLLADGRVEAVAACDTNEISLKTFDAQFKGRSYATPTELCADPGIEAVYVATPHGFHCEHVLAAARAGKHVLVEKPLAVTLDEGQRMVDACAAASVHLIVGPSHSFDAPVLKARELIDSGDYGRVRMIHALNCTDFLYRPRRPEELDTQKGGGVVFSQGAHQIDIVRLLLGGLATEVYAKTGVWDPARPTEGAYSALLSFADGGFASLTYSGYGRFDTDEWQGWVDELGRDKDPAIYGKARVSLSTVASPEAEAALKARRTYGVAEGGRVSPPGHHEQFGPVVVFCERGDLRLTPDGIDVFSDSERTFVPCPVRTPRAEVFDALVAAVRDGRPPVQTGAWGLATLEVCHALIESAATGRPVPLRHQVGCA